VTPPPIPTSGLLRGGRKRRRGLRPVLRRRGWRRRARASGAIRRCLGGSWGWGESLRLIGGAFYRPERRGQGRPVSGRRRTCWRRARATLASSALLACWKGLVSAAECCGSALARAGRSGAGREEDDWEGALGAILFFPPLLLARVGAGGAGLDRGVTQEHGDSARASQNSDHHSGFDLPRSLSASVRRNARKNLKFEFLKFSNLGDQHKSQGIQIYFCYQEWFSFAEILFRI
jgi:hypothetical protein